MAEAFGRFLASFVMLISVLVLLVLVSLLAGLMATLMVHAFLIGWDVL